MEGWVKLHRCLMEKAIWLQSTPEQKVILVTLLTMANHKEKQWIWQGKKFEAMPGQFVTSLDSIVKQCGIGVSKQNVRTAIEKFENLEFLTNESTKTGRLINIVNWRVYQAKEESTNIDANKDITKHQHRANIELTPNKNVIKKECNKNKYGEFENVLLTDIEYERLVKKYGKQITDKSIEFLDLHIEEKNYKSKSHVAAIQKWVVDAVSKKQTYTNQQPKKEELQLL